MKEFDKFTTYLSDKLEMAAKEGYASYSECVYKLAEGGMPLVQIAAKFQMSYNGVRGHLHRMGFKLNGRKSMPPAPTKMRLLYSKRGLTYREIAGHTGLSHTSIRLRLKKAGVAPRKPGKQFKDLGSLKTLYVDQGLSCSQIAKLKGAGITKVNRQLKAEGVELRAKGFHHYAK